MVHSPPWRVWLWRVSPRGGTIVEVEVRRKACGRDLLDPPTTPSPDNLGCWSPSREGDPVLRQSVAHCGLLDRRSPLRGRPDPWTQGDPTVTAWSAGLGPPMKPGQVLHIQRGGWGGTHGFGWSHDELSTIRAVIQREESLPRALSHGPLGMVLFFDLLAQAAELLDTNFLDGLGWVALPEMTPMEVSPGPREQGRPVEEPASSSLETVLTTYCHRCGGGSVSEQAQQVAPALAAKAQRSWLDMAGVSLEQTLSSATGWRLTVEGAVSSDYLWSQKAGQLSVMKLAAAMRHPALAPRPTTGDNVRWGP